MLCEFLIIFFNIENKMNCVIIVFVGWDENLCVLGCLI